MFFGQIITIPFAFLIKFKAAYVFTYIFGIFYGNAYKEEPGKKERKSVNLVIYSIAIIGLLARIYLDVRPVSIEAIGDLIVQWVKLFQGAAIFLSLKSAIPLIRSDTVKGIIGSISGYTYEVYIVDEFFTCAIFADLIVTESLPLKIIIVLLCICFTGTVLKLISNQKII